MKYIRTKDRIDLLRKGVDKYIVKDSDYSCEITIDEETLLKNYKVADTIEELCDEFVDDTYKDFYKIKKENGKTFVWSIKQRFKYWNSIDFDFIGTIYGAIYTSKGLIYVAKMNEEGELELI